MFYIDNYDSLAWENLSFKHHGLFKFLVAVSCCHRFGLLTHDTAWFHLRAFTSALG